MKTKTICSECGMPRAEWTYDGGAGVEREGETYCCPGCADGNGCICRQEKAKTERVLRTRDALSDPGHMGL